ncbi:hypothetical protein [Actinokineospora sp. HUAS TT18]|uniref:hypothetical protein n=1 Tax=Actinokineospora sp. HUAS TT18 TaxID=3447451 RepID=UPI003F524C6C
MIEEVEGVESKDKESELDSVVSGQEVHHFSSYATSGEPRNVAFGPTRIRATIFAPPTQYLATVGPEHRNSFRMGFVPTRSWLHELILDRGTGRHQDPLDPAVPVLAGVCRKFSSELGPFRLIHDHSKVMSSRGSVPMRLV